MAQITIVAVDLRNVTVNVLWEDGLSIANLVIPDVPVETLEGTQAYLFTYITGVYQVERAAANALAASNPVHAPAIMAAIGHTFDDTGAMIS